MKPCRVCRGSGLDYIQFKDIQTEVKEENILYTIVYRIGYCNHCKGKGLTEEDKNVK